MATAAARLVLPRRLSWDDIARLRASVGAVDAPVLTIEGEGGVFCEGGDAGPAAADDPRPREFAALLRALETAPFAVVALVDGPALGGGLGLAAAADVVLATRRSHFGLPETLVGLLPAMVFPPVARRIGVGRARRLALGAPSLTAEEALAQGLVDEIADDLPAAGARVCRRLERLSREAVRALKALVAAHFGTTDAYEIEAAAALVERLGSADARDRMKRFAEGGAPWPDDGP
jgi:enoyl-CoA hydratase/carnithine racemase